jgi:DNA invertase Pin-like site-specific DNA recombinase
MTIFSYARDSSDGQSFAAQVAQLRAAGCAEVYFDKARGAKSNRTELTRALRKLKLGDMLVVTRLDRLARSTWDLFNTLHMLAERNVGFQ